jgi:hypothetical protein
MFHKDFDLNNNTFSIKNSLIMRVNFQLRIQTNLLFLISNYYLEPCFNKPIF